MGTPPKRSGTVPAKPISLYPMSEDEAMRRLLRVPPPVKVKEQAMSVVQSVGGMVVTNVSASRATSVGASTTITAVAPNMKVTSVVVRENGKIVSAKTS